MTKPKKQTALFSAVSPEVAEEIVTAARIRDELETQLWLLDVGQAIMTKLPLRSVAPKVYNFARASKRKFRVETRPGEVYIARLS